MPPTAHPQFDAFYSNIVEPEWLKPWEGELYRQSHPRWLSKHYRFTGVGALLRGGRWNVQKLIPAVYGSLDPDTLHTEVNAKAHLTGWTKEDLRPSLRIAYRCRISAALDLTERAVLRRLKVSRTQLVSSPWEKDQLAGLESLTQAISRAAFERGAEGIIVPSARNPKGCNVVIFPTQLRPGSLMEACHENDIPFSHGLQSTCA